MNKMAGNTRQEGSTQYNNDKTTYDLLFHVPVDPPDLSTSYHHIMLFICTIHKLMPDYTQDIKPLNLKIQADQEPVSDKC